MDQPLPKSVSSFVEKSAAGTTRTPSSVTSRTTLEADDDALPDVRVILLNSHRKRRC
jgi:hypothetical protein